jgi:D-glycerate 3-kinase
MYQQLIEDFIQQEQLPASYAEDAHEFFLPLLRELKVARSNKSPGLLFLGINGAQGTGKSTLAKLLSLLLTSDGLAVANLSIDDFYFAKNTRSELAAAIHPLLIARGVPGTHDIALALRLFKLLGEIEAAESLTLPGFDKSQDDCLPVDQAIQVSGPIDVVILEGWFVGCTAQTAQQLIQPINQLEAEEDADGRWRNYVNQQLAGDYQDLFAQLDKLIVLQAPGFEQVLQWRSLQEQKLCQRLKQNASGLMDDEQIKRFVQHFERLSRHCLQTLPSSADYVFELNVEHRIQALSKQDQTTKPGK